MILLFKNNQNKLNNLINKFKNYKINNNILNNQ